MNDRITLQDGATPNKDEILTANFLILQNRKATVRFLAVSKNKNMRTPDIEMDDKKWEIKCPRGKGSNTIKRAFETASNQSSNIIFDLRHSKIGDRVNIPKIQKEFRDIKKVKNLKIITKSQKLPDFSK